MSKHQKAISAPKTFPIPRKLKTWVAKPSPGPHGKKECVPIVVIVRDVLGKAETMKEVRQILRNGKCYVNGKMVKDRRFPMGVFDSLQLGDDYYRLVPSKKGFDLVEIDEEEAGKRLSRIEDKKMLKGGRLQLNLDDGRNMIVGEDFDLGTGSVLLIKVPEGEILEEMERKKGCKVIITEGKNRGKIAELKDIKKTLGSKPNVAILEYEGREIDLPEKLVFPVGEEESLIEIGG